MKWEEKELDKIGVIGRGKSRHRPRNAEFLYGGDYPLIQTGDIQNANLYITTYKKTYSDAGLAQSKLWKKGTLCISIVGANTAETAILGLDACFPDSVIGFNAFEGYSDNLFIKYALEVIKSRLKSISEGTARENLSMEKLLSVKIPMPDFPIRKKIAGILLAYDDKIENNHNRISLLEEAAQNLYREWFVYFRFPGYEEAKFVDGLPVGWERYLAKDIFNIKIGKTPPRKEQQWFHRSEGIKWVSIRDINKSLLFILQTKEYISEDGVDKFNMNIAPAGSVILSFKLTVGKVAITTEDMVTNEAIAHFNIKDVEKITTEFTFCFLSNFNYDTMGSTSSIGTALNSKLVKAIPFIVPEKGLMKHFTEIVTPIFEQIKGLQQYNQTLKEARDILLPRLMNGTIEV